MPDQLPTDPDGNIHNREAYADAQPAAFSGRLTKVFEEIYRDTRYQMGATLVLINLLLLFTRPQSSLPGIGDLLQKGPFIVIFNCMIIPVWLLAHKKGWTTATKAMVCFLIFGFLWVPFARNNRWAYNTVVDLTIQFTTCYFPIAAFCAYRHQLQRLVSACSFIVLFLGAYATTHGGRGPSAFLGDENDLCLAIVALLPIPMMLYSRQSTLGRLFFLSAIGAGLAGAVTSFSRGGFVGLVLALAYVVLRSRARVALIFMAVMIASAGALLVPPDYWKEMGTISETDDGTAKKRKDIWAIGITLFLDPKNTLWGVGMENVKYWLADYEPAANQTASGTSVAGRAVHSMYIQMLTEVGLIGALLVGLTVGSSFFSHRRRSKEITRMVQSLQGLKKSLWFARSAQDLPSALATELFQDDKSEGTKKIREFLAKISQLEAELRTLEITGEAISACWIGMLFAAVFISVLYYPPLWLLAGISSAVMNHWKRLQPELSQLFQHPILRNPRPEFD